MHSRILYTLAALCVAAPAAAQPYSGVSPTGGTTIQLKAADDFATRAFQDPWDMSQRTDVGWWTWGTDTAAAGNFQNPSIANGVFTGSLNGAAAALFLLESPLQSTTAGGQTPPVGKTGQQYPIDANQYTHLVYRMSSTTGGVSQYIWSTTTIYDDQTIGVEIAQNATLVRTGWKVYDVDLSTLTSRPLLGPTVPWTGLKRAFQFLPLAGAPTGTIQIDWARLVKDDSTLKQTIAWTGGTADVYIDNDNDPTNGTLGRIAVNASSGFPFFVGALPAGRYYIALHSPTTDEVAGTSGTGSSFVYSTGSYVVNDIPTLQFATPSEEGSNDDFATSKLGDPWDFHQKTDVDSTLPGFRGTVNVVNDGITSLVLTNEAGVNLGPQTVYLGTSVAAGPGAANPSDPVGDPQVFTLFWDGKGKVNRIDPTRFRILTIEAGIPNKARSLPGGSVGRVIWRAANEPIRDATGTPAQTVGNAFAFNSAAGENTVAKISVDMNNYPVEPHSLDTATTWNSATAASGGLDGFRWDPHEFSPATNFFIKRIKIAALERTQSDQFTFRWTTSKTGTVTVYYDQDPGHTFTLGTQACQVVSAPAGAGSCLWSVPPGLAADEYQIYATIDDGTNSNAVYARTKVIVDHLNRAQTINLNRTTLNFSQLALGSTRTPPQTVRLTFSGPGSCNSWTATPNALGLLTITPSSGTGAANISIAATGNFPVGQTTTLFVTVVPCGQQANSRTIAVYVTGVGNGTNPVGTVDTPADASTVTGSVAVTGWATDTVGVASIAICRDPVGAEGTTPGQCAGQNQVFIGNGTFVEDARPDIQDAFPSSPLNYRAGWGYLMLTNFLPNQGNGPVRLSVYATNLQGLVALLGTKTITTANSGAIRPFGAIDTPSQGAVACNAPGTPFANFGWVMAQPGKSIPLDSSTINVFVDGVFQGHPLAPRSARSDITAAFPPPYEATTALTVFGLDTTLFSNGVHTLYWTVTDASGQSDGIGSRYFTISNPCTGG